MQVKFLENNGNVPSLDQMMRHIEHFFKLGAEKSLALGSDFDGAVLPECLNSPAKAAGLYGYLLDRGLSKEQAEGIMFKNAQVFFEKNF